MRERLEVGIFFLDNFGSWIDDFIEETHRQTDKLRLFKIDVQQFVPCDSFEVAGYQFPHPRALKELAIIFERYDCLILPITPETLVWTRVSLAQLGGRLSFPVVALASNVQPLAFLDLVSLGIEEYIFPNDDVSITRIRLSNIIERHKMLYRSFRQVLQKSQEFFQVPIDTDHVLEAINEMAMAAQKPKKKRRRSSRFSTDKVQYEGSFQDAKARVIKEFEKNYVVNALMESKGNICAAAQRSNKHRRAFWGLMRKYEIDADDYKVGE